MLVNLAIPLWGKNLDGVRRIDHQLGGQQAHGEETTDALDQTRSTSAATGADKDAERRVARYLLQLVSGNGADSKGSTPCCLAPGF